MPVNPNISLAVRGIELSDPVAQYGKIAAIQQAQQQNQLAQLQMQQAQREQESINAMNRAYAAAYDPQTGNVDVNQLRRNLAAGPAAYRLPGIEKGLAEAQAAQTKQQKEQSDLVDAKLKQSRQFLDTINPTDPDAPERYLAWHRANHEDPVLGPVLKSRGITAEQSFARIQQAIQQGPAAFAQLLNQSVLGIDEFTKQNKPTTTVVDQSGQRILVQTPGWGGKPVTVGTYADVPLPPKVEEQKIRIAQAGRAPGTTVNLMQEKAEAGARGKMLVDEYSDISKQAKLATKSLPPLESNLALLNRGFETGFTTEIQAVGAKVLGALGVQGAEKFATDAQTFLANAHAAVLQRQLEQKGPQTEADSQRITQTGAQLGNTVDANKFILSIAKAQLKRDIAQRNFYDKWWKTNKTYDGAEDAWYSGEGGKSLFDSPELKAYAVASVAPTGGASQIPTGRSTPATTKTATRTGVLNGRKVVQYSDGSIEYAD